MTLKVELDRLHRLGSVLRGLADEAGGLKTGFAYSSPPAISTGVPLQDAVYNASRSVPTSVTEALAIKPRSDRHDVGVGDQGTSRGNRRGDGQCRQRVPRRG